MSRTTGTTAKPSTPTATVWSPHTATSRQPGGEPEWIAKDIPPTGLIEEHEPRIYFGELQGQRPDQYSIVGAPAGTPPIELDTPGGGEGGNPKTYTYTGKGGVKIGSMWLRLLYAAKFADVNILLSDRIHPAIQDHLRPHAAAARAGRRAMAES